MSSGEWTPDRGDVVWIDMMPSAGHEQCGRRPAVVLSPSPYNRRVGLALLCPVTSQAKGYPFEVALPEGLAVSGVVLADQVRNLDWRVRRAEYACTAPSDCVDRVRATLGTLLA